MKHCLNQINIKQIRSWYYHLWCFHRNKTPKTRNRLINANSLTTPTRLNSTQQFEFSRVGVVLGVTSKKLCQTRGVFRTFFLWESHIYGSVVLTSSHEKCETRK